MRKIVTYVMGALMALFTAQGVQAQTVGIKTNLVSDGLMSPNLGIELGLAPRWTMQFEGQWNNWGVTDKGSDLVHQWNHWYASVEPRYWFCHKFAGHFISINVFGGEYDFAHLGLNFKFLNNDFRGLNSNRYKGLAAGAGFNWGYAWAVAKHWNIEFEVGVGWIWTRYDKYGIGKDAAGQPVDRDLKFERGYHNYVGPTKLALNVEYLF